MKAYVAMAAAIFAIGIVFALQIGSLAEATETSPMATAAETAIPWSPAAPSGGRAQKCDVESCWWGCCDANGACQLGTADDVCGIQGSPCDNCAILGYYCGPQQVCAAGVPCKDPGCDHYCCDAFGECRQYQGDHYCGRDGAACTNCAGEGKDCGSGNTGCATGPCSQTTCPYGCCDAGGQGCLPGTDDNACGLDAQTCQLCPEGQKCIAHVCQTPCSPATCSNGCCNGAVCVAFADQSNILCGAGGAACGTCAALLSVCLPTADGGQCGCDASSCPDGCCDDNGVYCRPGTDNDRCGGPGGAACVNCLNGGHRECVDRVCTPYCDSSYCTGCCSGTDCESGLDPSNCGKGGVVCVTCQEGWSCTNGVCTDDDDNDDNDDNDDDVSPTDDDNDDDSTPADDDSTPSDDDESPSDDDMSDDDTTDDDDDLSPGDDDDDASPGIHRAEHAKTSSGCGC